MSVTVNSIVVASPGQISADLQGEAVVLSLENDMYYGLGEVGARVWKLIHEARSVSDIRDVIVAEYDVDRETCEKDLIRFLGQLEAEELIVVNGGSVN